jgi:HPt (histidine-containing phosphotransfer) domain-containing protein
LLAHSLRGLAATLGADRVAVCAGELEMLGRRRQAVGMAEAIDALMQRLTPLIDGLQAHFTEEPVGSTTPVGVAQDGKLPDCIAQLRNLLSESDNDAMELWDAHRREFDLVISPQIVHRISTALQNIEFDVALALIDELVASREQKQ